MVGRGAPASAWLAQNTSGRAGAKLPGLSLVLGGEGSVAGAGVVVGGRRVEDERLGCAVGGAVLHVHGIWKFPRPSQRLEMSHELGYCGGDENSERARNSRAKRGGCVSDTLACSRGTCQRHPWPALALLRGP